MNVMKFIKIYAASVRETMGWARRQTTSRSLLNFNDEFES